MKTIQFLCFLFILTANAQVTLRITSLPANTPNNSTIYLAGSVNNWNEANPQFIMQPDGLGVLQITIPEGNGQVSYKFTRGSWTSVEGNANGGFLPNRSFTFTGSPQTINVTIQSWEDISGSGSNSTAASNVQILDANFFIPQLNRNRKIWLYLPPDYFTSTKTYPVLYMQDGQNLFDNATSFSGEWQIDETLNSLHSQGDFGAIVVGIENGGSNRLNEYSPWNNPNYGGGEGEEYIQFISETLKPYIDTNFRTKTQPQFNALIGSSMGALISTFGAVEYPEFFNKIGSFSPAYWFAINDLNNHISTATNDVNNLKIYFVCGQNESSSMVSNVNTIKNTFLSKGVLNSNLFTKFDSYGTHTESYWRGEFSACYQWLFAGENLEINTFDDAAFQLYQVGQNKLFCSGLDQDTSVDIYSLTGQKIASQTVSNGLNLISEALSNGIYIIKLKDKVVKFIK